MSQSLSNQTTLFGKTFDLPSIFAFIGAAGSGKSYLLQYLIQEISQQGIFKFGWCFTRTNFSNAYAYMGKNVTVGYSESILKSYLSVLAKMRKTLNMNMPPSFIIFDDLIGSLVNSQNNQTFMRLITTFRHYNCSIFIAAQYARGMINPTLREQIRYVFCTDSGLENTNNLFKSFGNRFFENKTEMADVLTRLNAELQSHSQIIGRSKHYNERSHKFLVMDTSKSNISTGCFVIEAPKFKPVQLISD